MQRFEITLKFCKIISDHNANPITRIAKQVAENSLDLTKFADYDSFIAGAQRLTSGYNADCWLVAGESIYLLEEVMTAFGIEPKVAVEVGIPTELWADGITDYIEAALKIDDNDLDEAIELAGAAYKCSITPAQIHEKFMGKYSLQSEFVDSLFEMTTGDEIPVWLKVNYPDTAYNLLRYDYRAENCHYFKNS